VFDGLGCESHDVEKQIMSQNEAFAVRLSMLQPLQGRLNRDSERIPRGLPQGGFNSFSILSGDSTSHQMQSSMKQISPIMGRYVI
jgi:hypothetical protein